MRRRAQARGWVAEHRIGERTSFAGLVSGADKLAALRDAVAMTAGRGAQEAAYAGLRDTGDLIAALRAAAAPTDPLGPHAAGIPQQKSSKRVRVRCTRLIRPAPV